MRARVCFLKMTEDPWSTEVAIQHPLPGAGLIDDSGSATSNPPVAIRRGRRLSPTFISPGRLCCQPEYHRYHVALVSVVVDLVFLYRRDNPVELPGAPSPRVGPRHLRRTPVGEPSEGSLMFSTSRCRYRNREARTYQLRIDQAIACRRLISTPRSSRARGWASA